MEEVSKTSSCNKHGKHMQIKLLNVMMRPIYAQGLVVKGLGRGSKDLGIPTANFPEEVVEILPPDASTGIYFGWAQVANGIVHKMVMSIGWNPYYNNEKKSMETHILHDFDKDFYDFWLKVVICGYIRPEENFKSIDALIDAINSDIRIAKTELDKEKHQVYMNDEFFQDSDKCSNRDSSLNSDLSR